MSRLTWKPSPVTSSVEPPPMSTTSVSSSTSRPEVAPRNVSAPFLVAGQEAGGEAVAPLDLAQERLAVLGVADRARADRQRALGAELLDPPPVVGEAVADARDGEGEQLATAVDALAELREAEIALELVDTAVLDVRDQ